MAFEADFLLYALFALLAVALVWEYLKKRPNGNAKAETGTKTGEKSEERAGEKSGDEKVEAGEKAGEESESPIVVALIVAIIGRIVLGSIPSIEPVIPLAVFTGLIGGAVGGATVGVLGYAVSNLFLPGGIMGMWTIWQAIGGGIAGAAGGIAGAGRKSAANAGNLVMLTFFGTIAFEVIVNIGSALEFNPAYFISALPFSVAHIVGNIVIAMMLVPFLPKE